MAMHATQAVFMDVANVLNSLHHCKQTVSQFIHAVYSTYF